MTSTPSNLLIAKTILPNRAVLKLTGEDTTSFLQGLITQDINKLSPISAIYSALLSPQGKFLADFFLINYQSAVWLDTHQDFAVSLFKKLKLYRLRADVKITDETEKMAVGAVWPDIGDGEAGRMMGIGRGDSGAVAYTDPRYAAMGLRVLAPKYELEKALDNFEGDHKYAEAYRAFEISLGIPAAIEDLQAEQIFPLDANLDALAGIDYKKGCFVGQEVSSRMWRKGSIRKRIWCAYFDGTAPEKSTPVTKGETTIGEISSVSGTLALVKLRLDRFEKAQGDIMAGTTSLRLTRPAYLES